ncbi:MAG TPA: uracil-DNA glycosylase [Candidatus Acidoferrales bacterium]|nr:uracil-DNA glycosylase [Candidatus Acidoferrales bacterium]
MCNPALSLKISYSMDTAKQSQVEAWLQYADDLDLGPFFRNRSRTAPPAADARAADESLSVVSKQVPSSQLPAQSASATTAAKPATPLESSSRSNALSKQAPGLLKPAAVPAFTQKASEISLFEEKVENDSLEKIRADIGPDCTRCKLHKARTQVVFGVGNPNAELVFVGEGPGHDEDLQGEPFVGRAGKLLTQMIEAMGLKRSDVYIANVVKCRPPENRLPEKDEIAACSPYLIRQIDAIKPKVIVCLGACSAQTLLQTNQGISKFRGQFFDFRGARLMATYHPAYLLRNPPAKADVWKDLQKVMAALGLEVKKRS